MKATVYKKDGKKAGDIELPDVIFGQNWNEALVWQVCMSIMSNMRQGSAHTKDRSEVSGTGKKPWRQKGTSRARHGSRRSPIWVGGGVAFGPRNEKDYSKKINRKMREKAMVVALSRKFGDNEVLLLEDIGLDEVSTKSADAVFEALQNVEGFETLNTKKNPNNILLVAPEKDEKVVLSVRNLPNVKLVYADNLNALDLAKARYVVVVNPEAVSAKLEDRFNRVLSNQSK